VEQQPRPSDVTFLMKEVEEGLTVGCDRQPTAVDGDVKLCLFVENAVMLVLLCFCTLHTPAHNAPFVQLSDCAGHSQGSLRPTTRCAAKHDQSVTRKSKFASIDEPRLLSYRCFTWNEMRARLGLATAGAELLRSGPRRAQWPRRAP
jgi:hypothetical protein